jgi:hypothetical protein
MMPQGSVVEYAHRTPQVDAARDALLRWKDARLIRFDTTYRHLASLLGVYEVLDLTDDQLDICAALGGEHGWAFYKILLIKRGLE